MNMMEKIPVAIWSGEVAILGVKLKCFVLDDGRRIIDADSMGNFMIAMADPERQWDKSELAELMTFLKGRGMPEGGE